MRWVSLFVAFASSGCFVLDCPRGSSYCEGEVLTQCATRCSGDSKTNRSCSPSVTSIDCATAFLATTGVRKTCRELSYTQSGHELRAATCLDAPLTPCAVAPGGGRVGQPLSCLPSGRILFCYTSGSEAFEDTRECEAPGLTCTPGLACVDDPLASCDPAQYPRCEGGRFDRRCVGRPDSGYFVRTTDCGASRFCKTSDAGLTFCADQP